MGQTAIYKLIPRGAFHFGERGVGVEETADLLQYVYHTEPMRHARRGDKLDFSVVPSGTHYYELYVPVQKPTVRRLRESLRSYALDDVDEFVRPTTVYDEVLDEGLRVIHSGESDPRMALYMPGIHHRLS